MKTRLIFQSSGIAGTNFPYRHTRQMKLSGSGVQTKKFENSSPAVTGGKNGVMNMRKYTKDS